jgi:GNAT superfamily N-acetyltransferase
MDGMRGQRTHGNATCRLSYSQAIPAHMRGGIREITSIYVSESFRGCGDASALMKEVCNEADDNAIVLMLIPKPFDHGLDQLQLIAWYARHGFIQIQDNPILMARQPYG